MLLIADTRSAGCRMRPAASSVLAGRRGRCRARQRVGVEAVTIGRRAHRRRDCVLVSGGWTPTVHLFCQARGKLALRRAAGGFRSRRPGRRHERRRRGQRHVRAVAPARRQRMRQAAARIRRRVRQHADETYGVAPAWPRPGARAAQWIDFQNDVTAKDIELAARENFVSVEHLKRYTTLGMATDQGKTSNMNGLAAMAAHHRPQHRRDRHHDLPAALRAGAVRGRCRAPARRALQSGAAAGAARTSIAPSAPCSANMAAGCGRPITAPATPTRRSSAKRGWRAAASRIFDGSPLGKIEVLGPDAGALVDYNSYNTMST